MNTLAELEILLNNQRRALRWYVSFAVALFSSGVVLLGIALLSGKWLSPEPIKTVLGISGGLISSVSVFPLKEVTGCQDRTTVYERLMKELRASPQGDKERIDQLVWEVIKKVALG